MDLEKRIELITRAPAEEVLTLKELRELLETNDHPIAYNGFEPSGKVHLGTGLICAYKMKDLIEAGVKYKVYLATWHALINNKLGGDISLINKAAEHFKHSWLSLGVPEKKVEFLYAEKEYNDREYWRKMINIARKMTLARGKRTLQVMGRKEDEATHIADYIYTPMQVADVFQFKVNICQLGMDQRKANVVARELGEDIGYWKPICIHHHLLQGLAKPAVWPIPEGEAGKEALASGKMSKSKPETCVFVYDSPEDIRKKITNAFCPERVIEYNPIVDIARHIVFREKESIMIERPEKFGGNLEIQSFEELSEAFRKGNIHPLDLKKAVAEVLVEVLEPARKHFAKNKEAKEGLEVIEKAIVTR